MYNIYMFYQGDLAGAFWQLYHAGMHEYTGGLEPVAGTICQNFSEFLRRHLYSNGIQ